MKIGILSDTHNDYSNIQKALAIFENHKPDILIFCGDATTVESIEWFCEYPIIYTFGNGDFLTGEIKAYLKAYNQLNFAGYVYKGVLGGRKIGVTHGHLLNYYDDMINDEQLDYLFSGHTHVRMDKRIGRTRQINPGAIGGTRKQSRSIAILDTDTDELIFEILEE